MGNDLKSLKNVSLAFGILGGLGMIGILYLIIFGNLSGNLGFTNTSAVLTVTNETNAYINTTGYTLAGVTSANSGYTLTAIWNVSLSGNYNVTVGLGNATTSAAGVVTNATSSGQAYNNVSLTYTLSHSYPSSGLNSTNNVINNVTSGYNSFFSNYGTLFVILFVVALISIVALVWVVFKESKMDGGSVTSRNQFAG